MLAHNSVDRCLMARDSIELNLDDSTPSPGKLSRARWDRSIQHSDPGAQHSAFSTQPGESSRPRRIIPVRAERTNPGNQDDSELLINRDDLDLEELDSEEARFLRTERRVPVRRSPIPKKAASQLQLAGVIAAVVVAGCGLGAWAYCYGMLAPRFSIESSDSVEISGVRNASRSLVMEVAG